MVLLHPKFVETCRVVSSQPATVKINNQQCRRSVCWIRRLSSPGRLRHWPSTSPRPRESRMSWRPTSDPRVPWKCEPLFYPRIIRLDDEFLEGSGSRVDFRSFGVDRPSIWLWSALLIRYNTLVRAENTPYMVISRYHSNVNAFVLFRDFMIFFSGCTMSFCVQHYLIMLMTVDYRN